MSGSICLRNNEIDPYPPVKITFVGDASVGKTSLVQRFSRNDFSETTSSTIGAAFVAMRFPVRKGDKGRLYHIWDTAGQERYSSLIPLYVSGARVIVVVYDITNHYSFQRIGEHWLKYIRQNLRLNDDEPLPMIYLLGNKKDLASKERSVTIYEAQTFAAAHDMGFLEVSAKTGEGAQEVFMNIANHADELVIRQADALKLSRADLERDEQASPGCCSGAIARVDPTGWWST
jgi:Ras-related protein Rab-5C